MKRIHLVAGGTCAALAVAAVVVFAPCAGAGPGVKGAAPTAEGAAAPKAEGAAAPTISPAAPVVVVNGKPILRAEFDRAMNAYLHNFRQSTGAMHGKVSEPNDAMKAEVLEQLVDRELLYQESLKFPVENKDGQVAEELAGIQARFPSPEAFQEALQTDGLSEEGLRDLIGRQVMVRHYVEGQMVPTVKVTDEEVGAFYKENEAQFEEPEQVQCSHILLRVAPEAPPEAKAAVRKKAEELRARCLKGEDFGALAREHSEDPGSKDDGGDLGLFPRERMVPPFATAAFALAKIGDVSEVVETQFGYHIIKLTGREAANRQTLEEVKGPIADYLRSMRLDEVVKGKVTELKAAAKIDVVAPHL